MIRLVAALLWLAAVTGTVSAQSETTAPSQQGAVWPSSPRARLLAQAPGPISFVTEARPAAPVSRSPVLPVPMQRTQTCTTM